MNQLSRSTVRPQQVNQIHRNYVNKWWQSVDVLLKFILDFKTRELDDNDLTIVNIFSFSVWLTKFSPTNESLKVSNYWQSITFSLTSKLYTVFIWF